MTRPSTAFGALAAIGALLVATSSVHAADPEHGHILAKTWCAGCHAVDASATTARDTPPSFASIAKRPDVSDSALRGWLNAPHPNMPNFDLSRATVDDLVAYILSLK